MEQAARPQLKVREAVFGGGKYLLCVPLAGSTVDQLIAGVNRSLEFNPDLYEWRVDYFGSYPQPGPVLEALAALRAAVGNKPILFTPRHFAEDGASDIPDGHKFELIDHVSRTGLVDLIDIEQRYGRACLSLWSKKLHERSVRLVISHHEFHKKMNPGEVLKVLQCGQEWGADIGKIIVKASSFKALADFSDAIHEARDTFLKIPVIAGAVGKASPLMRVLGDYLGSDMTFAMAGGRRSHAAQLHIQDIRRFRDRIR
ncbi:type I 3-dehydroquinate dehydratase [Paenibacillus sp. S150]|uniref:type I 3-dehydroquinate dehydratase n=1 Tax=Paenibacillus sp. S150 TaxID=2749826 RepID=UPI001C58A538|nr:type I 3-dehydroquinate dehydratase [Paenibacillus sp. S150]MBW4081213.1 type I 3-dehydroquinate dehydratase [Paenibacillus sp. S150]